MKKYFNGILASLPVMAFFYCLSFTLVTTVSGCGNSSDSSGNSTGTKMLTSKSFAAGSQLVVICNSKVCGSSDSSGTSGGPKLLFNNTISFELPANSELEFRIVPKGEPVFPEKTGSNK